MVYQTTEDSAESRVSEERSHKYICLLAVFMEIRDRYRDYIPVYTDGSRDGSSEACAIVLPSDTLISMRLPDPASIFTAEVWQSLKPWNK